VGLQFDSRTPEPPAFRCLSATERVPLEEGGQSGNVGRTSVRQFAILLSVGQPARPTCPTETKRSTFHVPLTEGDTGGGKISFHLFALLEIVYRCCRLDFSSTAEDHNPLRSVACQQGNASPLVKGDKVRGLLNVLSGVSSRQQAHVASLRSWRLAFAVSRHACPKVCAKGMRLKGK
jgi:hypothetical protein